MTHLAALCSRYLLKFYTKKQSSSGLQPVPRTAAVSAAASHACSTSFRSLQSPPPAHFHGQDVHTPLSHQEQNPSLRLSPLKPLYARSNTQIIHNSCYVHKTTKTLP